METRDRAKSRARAVLASAGLCSAVIGGGLWVTAADAGHLTPSTLGHTTVEQRIVADEDPEFRDLSISFEAGEPYIVREEGLGTAQEGRHARRDSLFYFGHLSDFQLSDEESPSRLEFLDYNAGSSAWRPHEAFHPHVAETMIRQLNAFADASPITAGDGSRSTMDITVNTGDAADNQQLNETEWVRTLAEGGPGEETATLNPGSGENPTTSDDPLCVALGTLGLVADGNAPEKYTGVQDFDDYVEGPTHQYYDPDQPSGAFADWPSFSGLMDAAQKPFQAEGLDVPHYVTFGNHDALALGNEDSIAPYEMVGTGCVKPMSPLTFDVDTLEEGFASLDPDQLLSTLATNPDKVALVPPDERRQYVSKKQYIDVFRDGDQPDGHGFDFIDQAEEDASRGAAGYYTWNPKPGLRLIVLDTVSEGGVTGVSHNGNVDDPQFQWLQGKLEAAEAADELVILASHHDIPTLTANVPDELAAPCTVDDAHGHDVNPGCDLDPRISQPIHLAEDMKALLHQYPHVIAWVAGHSHVNDIDPYPNPSGDGGFWGIRVAAEADWPQQSRLLEIFNNNDGTLSIFGTILDHAAPATSVDDDTDASKMSFLELASVGRTIAANDPQFGEGTSGAGDGEREDRNVELLVADPRGNPGPGPGPGPGSDRCEVRIEGTGGKDRLRGTAASERILGRGGRDRLSGLGGRDCVKGGPGKDRVKGGADRDKLAGGRGKDNLRGGGGKDRLAGSRGADKLVGGTGKDKLRGGNRGDRINAMDGERDRVNCGRGNDFVRSDFKDVLRNCERGVSGGP